MTRPFRTVHSRSILPKRDARVGEAVMMLCSTPHLDVWDAHRLARLYHLRVATAEGLLAAEAKRRTRPSAPFSP